MREKMADLGEKKEDRAIEEKRLCSGCYLLKRGAMPKLSS